MGVTGTIKVMTFNLRIATETDQENWLEHRKPRVVKLLKSEEPDVIGFQEAGTKTREWLRGALLPEYDLIGCGRGVYCTGEGIPVAFRRDRFQMMSLETVWLSETPQVPGSRLELSDQSRFPRMTHIITLSCIGQEQYFRVINTHLDHKGKEARRLELEMLEKQVGKVDCPAVLTGDFNAQPHFAELLEFNRHLEPMGWKDATDGLPPTFHGFGKRVPQIKIDYIYTNCPFSESRVVVNPPENGVYDSDHHAVVTTLQI